MWSTEGLPQDIEWDGDGWGAGEQMENSQCGSGLNMCSGDCLCQELVSLTTTHKASVPFPRSVCVEGP